METNNGGGIGKWCHCPIWEAGPRDFGELVSQEMRDAEGVGLTDGLFYSSPNAARQFGVTCLTTLVTARPRYDAV